MQVLGTVRLAAACAASAILVTAAGCDRATPDSEFATLVDGAVRYEMQDKTLPSVAVVAVKGDEIVLSVGWELESGSDPVRIMRTPNASVDGRSVVRVASVSKLFTATALMQLVEDGRVNLDEDIRTYLPEFSPGNPFGKPVTVRQLVTHRSGIVREPPVGNYFDPTEPSLNETVASLNETTLVYPPTTRTKYSNAAVSVAGKVIESVTGQPFAEVVRSSILEPAEMHHSSFEPRSDLIDDLAPGFMWTYDGRRFNAPVFEMGIGPAAGLYTTMEDLGKFLQTLFQDFENETESAARLLSRSSLEEMWKVQFSSTVQNNGFGLGFYVSEFDGHHRFQHSGVQYGYATRVYGLPEEQIGVAIVSMLDATNVVVDRLGEYVLSLLLSTEDGDLPAYPQTMEPNDGEMQALAGTYYSESKTVDINRRPDGWYFFDGTEYNRIKTDQQGLVLDGRLSRGTRIDPRPDAILVDSVHYAREQDYGPAPFTGPDRNLIGEYGWDHNTLYILERDGQLWALIEWFFHYPLERMSRDVFAFPQSGLYMGERLIFSRDSTGAVESVEAANIVWRRRNMSDGQTFRINPVRAIDELRREALAASPPVEKRAEPFRQTELTELTSLEPSIRLDIRYATENNFMGAQMYEEPRAFLQRPAAEALVRVHLTLAERGYGIVIYDGYRPWYVTKMFWDATPPDLREFVANPARGSRHNRGGAVDVGLYELTTGQIAEMPSGYDEFTTRAYPFYAGGTERQRYNRDLLRSAMEKEGFAVYESEWWHFDYHEWSEYAIANKLFSEINDE